VLIAEQQVKTKPVRAHGFFISRLYLLEFGLFPALSSLPLWGAPVLVLVLALARPSPLPLCVLSAVLPVVCVRHPSTPHFALAVEAVPLGIFSL
jgi:hypothetical protein